MRPPGEGGYATLVVPDARRGCEAPAVAAKNKGCQPASRTTRAAKGDPWRSFYLTIGVQLVVPAARRFASRAGGDATILRGHTVNLEIGVLFVPAAARYHKFKVDVQQIVRPARVRPRWAARAPHVGTFYRLLRQDPSFLFSGPVVAPPIYILVRRRGSESKKRRGASTKEKRGRVAMQTVHGGGCQPCTAPLSGKPPSGATLVDTP